MKNNIRIFVTNNFITTLGNSIFTIILMWHVYELTSSAVYTAIIGSLGHVIGFFLGPLAGVIADRSNKPLNLLIKTLYFNAIIVILLVLSITFASENFEIVSIIILVLIREIIFNFQYPSQTRVLPLIVSSDLITKLIGYRSVTSNIASIIGNSVAGFIISIIGVIGGLLLNSFTFFISSLLLSFISIINSNMITKENTIIKPSLKDEFLDGLKYLWNQKDIRIIAIIASLLNITSMVGPMFVVYFNDFINAGPEFYGVFNAIIAIGSIVAGISIHKINKSFKNSTIVIVGWSILSISLLLMFFSINITVIIIIAFLLGFSLTSPNIVFSSIQILAIPDHYRGRVTTTIRSLSVSLIPLSNILGGIIADLIGVNFVFLIAGMWQILIVIITIKHKNIFNTNYS